MTSAVELSDWELVAAAKAGDSAAFGGLWVRHHRFLRAVAAKRLGTAGAQAVDDVVSEVALKAWRALGSVQPTRETARGWLSSIAWNAATDWHKARSRAIVLLPREPLGDEDWSGEHATSAEVVALERVAADTIARRVAGFIDGMSEVDREYVRLRWGAGLSTVGVAAVLGVSRQCAGARERRLLDRLYRALARDGLTSSAACVEAWPDIERKAC